MAISYQVFSNDGAGGPIDYGAPIATVSGTSYTAGPLAATGNYRYAVRTLDTATGLAESNTQAAVRVRLDASGADLGPTPNAPFGLVARPTAGGGCLVRWSYFPAGQAALPGAFSVSVAAVLPGGTSPSAASIDYVPGVSSYCCRLAGLADGATCTVTVVARAAGGSSPGPAAATTVVGDASPPGDVVGLSASAVP